MFGTKDKKKDYRGRGESNRKSTAPNGSPAGGINTIDEHTTITGDLEASGDIRIDGKVNGNLKCLARMIIGHQGVVTGDVVCESALIEGSYTGAIVVKDLLTIKETGRMKGSILARKMAVAAGSAIDGTVSVNESVEPTALALPAGPEAKAKKQNAPTRVPAET
jgi:cytoskeletal protein CcmA (bactofilin family)